MGKAESRGEDASVSLFKENNGIRDLQRKTNAYARSAHELAGGGLQQPQPIGSHQGEAGW